MNKKLYIVRITRLVLAASEHEAQQLACSAANRGDVDCVDVINGLYDLPVGSENAVPYGSDQLSAYKILVTQIASDPRFKSFEVHPCMASEEDEHSELLDECEDSDASLWSVYGQLVTGGLECLADFNSRAKAESLCDQIHEIQGLWAQADEYYSASGTLPTSADDEFLENLYEDRVSCGNYEDF
jgi:hypothetical protein